MGKLNAKLMGNSQHVKGLAVSGNDDWLYVSSVQKDGNDLYAVKASNIADQSNWKKIEYGADRKKDGFDDKDPGKANLENANQIASMAAAKDGVVVGAGTSDLTSNDQKTGAFYVKEDKIVNAWNHTGNPGLHVVSSSLLNDEMKVGEPIRSYVVSKDNKEIYIYEHMGR